MRRQRGWSLALLGVMLLVASGCQNQRVTPASGYEDPYPAPLNDPPVTVLAPELQQWLVFQDAFVAQDGMRPMHVEVPVRNLAEQRYMIDYRIIFYDDQQRTLEPIMGWKMETLYPKQILRLKAGALSTEAADWRCEVKWSE